MDFGKPVRVVAETTAPEPVVVSPNSCRLMAVFCASVGLTGLPVDPAPPEPPGEPVPPTIVAVVPETGADGSEVIISGADFGAQGPNSKVTIGGEDCPILAWNDSECTVTAVQGGSPNDMPMPVRVTAEDGQQSDVTPAPGFTFTAAEVAVESRKGKKGKDAKRHPRERVAAKALVVPEFPSGGGVMLTDGAGAHILCGPFGVEGGHTYDLGIDCSHGLAVLTSGSVDLMLVLAPPL
jgi:hypothetical protein